MIRTFYKARFGVETRLEVIEFVAIDKEHAQIDLTAWYKLPSKDDSLIDVDHIRIGRYHQNLDSPPKQDAEIFRVAG